MVYNYDNNIRQRNEIIKADKEKPRRKVEVGRVRKRHQSPMVALRHGPEFVGPVLMSKEQNQHYPLAPKTRTCCS